MDRYAYGTRTALRAKRQWKKDSNVSTAMVRDESNKSIVLRPYSLLKTYPTQRPNGTNAQRGMYYLTMYNVLFMYDLGGCTILHSY